MKLLGLLNADLSFEGIYTIKLSDKIVMNTVPTLV
jgi:hypothetical protein